MSSMFQILLGLIAGVFLASYNPQAAEHIRASTFVFLEAVKGIVM